MAIRIVLASLLVLLAGRAHAQTCGVEAPCAVGGGTYRVSPPPGAPAGAAMFLHGYQGSGDDMMLDETLRAGFRDAGILLVLPNGPGRAWHVAGEPGNPASNRPFIAAVAADVAARWPVARKEMWLAGFSVGASMVWDVACHTPPGGDGFAAFVAISGQFWNPAPIACESGPVDLLQIHGLTDDVFPLEGRAIGPAHQGDVFEDLAIMRSHDGCRSNPETMVQQGAFVLRSWTNCWSGAQLALALHPGGHEIPAGWLSVALPFVRAAIARQQSAQ
jgi:polyhydroxybutyrate depolymerase